MKCGHYRSEINLYQMPIKGESLGEPRLSYKRLTQVITLHRTEIQIRFPPFEQARCELTYNLKHNARERASCDFDL